MRSGRLVGATILTVCVLGCAANPRVAEPGDMKPGDEGVLAEDHQFDSESQAADTPTRIETIVAEPAEGGTLIRILADRPLSYTSYDPDRSTLVIELPDVNVQFVEPMIEVDSPQLESIEVAPGEFGGGARIMLMGRMAEETRIQPMGNELHVFLQAMDVTETTPADEQPDAALEQAAVSPEDPAAGDPMQSTPDPMMDTAPPARSLDAIRISGTDSMPVFTLQGDGALVYTAFELDNPARLVVDIQGAKNAVPESEMHVGSWAVERIRVSQFSVDPRPVARVVFDLNDSLDYEVLPGRTSLDVVLSSPSATADAGTMEPVEMKTADAPETMALMDMQDESSAGDDSMVPEQSSSLQPVSMDLDEVGDDVVLFDRAEPQATPGTRMAEGESQHSLQTLPDNIYESRTIAGGKQEYRGEKISVAFRDADLREVMFFFADVMKMNVVLDPDVTGKVDIRLNQVPWDQAFQVILKNQGLDAVEEDNVVRIAKTTKLRQEAADLRALKTAQEQAVDPVTFTRTLSYAKVADAVNVLQQVKSDRGKIVADIRTNTLVISDIPFKKQAYDGLLDALDTQTPQVIIESRIVEAVRSYERDLGINWSLAGLATQALGTQTNLQFPHRVEFTADVNTAPPGFPSAGTVGLALGNVLDSVTLDIQLQAFEADGKVRILSSPKIATQNNQPATIEQGVQIPVVTTTATEVDVQYVPASLRMIVTPQITAEDTVIMKVTVENNQPSTTISVADVPGIVTESVDTQILVRSGTTAVIGGVYKLQETENETGIPGLRKIPFLGWLFKNRVNQKDSSELLVFITPKIVKNI